MINAHSWFSLGTPFSGGASYEIGTVSGWTVITGLAVVAAIGHFKKKQSI
ncbi:hypothetical protein [Bacillus sp. JCM 19041]